MGRTGILICIWLIYKLDFKAEIAIAWLRINRPGSIHGFQGHFVKTLTKDPDEYVNHVLHPIKRFENFHSTKNYYTGKYKIIS